MWSLLKGDWNVYVVTVSELRWPPCPYSVKTLKTLLLQNQGCFEAKSWYIASRLTVYQVYSNDSGRLTFDLLTARLKLRSMYLYGENIKKSFSQGSFIRRDRSEKDGTKKTGPVSSHRKNLYPSWDLIIFGRYISYSFLQNAYQNFQIFPIIKKIMQSNKPKSAVEKTGLNFRSNDHVLNFCKNR